MWDSVALWIFLQGYNECLYFYSTPPFSFLEDLQKRFFKVLQVPHKSTMRLLTKRCELWGVLNVCCRLVEQSHSIISCLKDENLEVRFLYVLAPGVHYYMYKFPLKVDITYSWWESSHQGFQKHDYSWSFLLYLYVKRSKCLLNLTI